MDEPNQLDSAPDTLGRIFPEANTLEEKAILFLELKDRSKSFREVSRALGPMDDTGALIHHQTISKLYRFLQRTTLYQDYVWAKNEQIRDFLSSDFIHSLHQDYKEQRQRCEDQIAAALKAKDTQKALEWMREKRLLLKDILNAAVQLAPKEGGDRPPVTDSSKSETAAPKEKDAFTTAMENWEKAHNDGQGTGSPN